MIVISSDDVLLELAFVCIGYPRNGNICVCLDEVVIHLYGHSDLKCSQKYVRAQGTTIVSQETW